MALGLGLLRGLCQWCRPKLQLVLANVGRQQCRPRDQTYCAKTTFFALFPLNPTIYGDGSNENETTARRKAITMPRSTQIRVSATRCFYTPNI